MHTAIASCNEHNGWIESGDGEAVFCKQILVESRRRHEARCKKKTQLHIGDPQSHECHVANDMKMYADFRKMFKALPS